MSTLFAVIRKTPTISSGAAHDDLVVLDDDSVTADDAQNDLVALEGDSAAGDNTQDDSIVLADADEPVPERSMQFADVADYEVI